MHNWEHFGRLPAYLLAATLVASCGGGGDSLLNITGVSDANVVLTAAAGAKLSKQGELIVTLQLTDVNKSPLANKPVALTVSSSNVSLSSSTVTTNASGVATFTLKGKITGDLNSTNNSGTVTATYTDEKGDVKSQKINYTIVDVSELQSSYSLNACFVTTANPCASSVVLKTAGSDSSAKVEFTLYDSADIATRKPLSNQKVNFSLLKVGSAALSKSNAFTDVNGKVSVDVHASTQVVANSVIASVTDSNGVETSSAIGFDVIIGNKVTFVASKTELLSGGDSTDLTALVVSASGNVQKDIPVSFSLVNPEAGVVLKNPDSSSSAEGKAKVTLELSNAKGANLANHTIQVRAAIGSGSDYSEELVNLNVVGTQVELTTTNNSVKIGANPTVSAVLKNGKGQAIANQTLTFTSSEIKDQTTGQFLNVTAITDSSGKVSLPFKDSNGNNKAVLVVDKSNNGKASIKAVGLGAESSLSFDVSERNFDLVFAKSGVPISEIDIREGGDIELTLRDDSGATLPDSIPVTVTTTLGKILPPTVLTKVAGSPNIRKATIRLTSSFPGTATVRAAFIDSATNNQVVATGTVALVSKIADKLAVQAVTPILAPGAETNIVAKVRDVNDNPVKGVAVNFELENPLGGSLNTSLATTNDKGEAVITFTAGSNDTGTEKVKVLATVPNEYTGFSGARTQTLNLTVGGEAVFISIATGNIIQEITTTTYAVPHQITVTDATGAPIANKEIKLSVWPVNYYKGFYVYSEALKVWVANTTAECSNEDANQNGVMDPWENNKVGNALSPLDYPAGEDVDVEDNGDGKLWPGNPVTLSTSTVTTGADGIAYFNVLYGQSYASWLRVKLTAKAQVSGTESQSDRIFRLPASSEDLTNEKSTPPGGTISAYGSSNLCSDPN
ncbi:MAG: Ig-like domain-containing protein [Moraxellaceae bacterium]|nr:Ig-like domain-containing protein [Moraxellaceae bacterium]